MRQGFTIQSVVVGVVRRVVWCAILSLVLGLPTLALGQGVIYVAADAPAGGNGQTWASAYNNLATALAEANAGTEVWVKQGTYATTTGFVVPSGVGVYGGFAGTETRRDARSPRDRATILSGSHASNVVTLDNASATTVLDGFQVIDAWPGPLPTSVGSGIRIRGGSPTIRDCQIRNCAASNPQSGVRGGGGLDILMGARPTIVRCSISHCAALGGRSFGFNYPAGDGGGALVREDSDATFVECTFDSNTPGQEGGECAGGHFFYVAGGRGGGIRVDSATVRLADCVFVNNRSPNGSSNFIVCNGSQVPSTPGTPGGAIHASGSVFATNCTFVGNRAGNGGHGYLQPGSWGASGGAVYMDSGSGIFTNCKFIANFAGNGGNAGFFDMGQAAGSGGSGAAISAPTLRIEGCLFAGNVSGVGGAGVPSNGIPEGLPGYAAVYGGAMIRNCTFVGNVAVAAPAGIATSAPLLNSILFNNTANGVQDQAAQTNATSASYSCIQGLSTITGPGNIDATPLFRDPDGPDNIPGTADDDYSLAPGSPCIDAGSNALVPATLVLDIGGRPRRRDDPRTPDHGVGPAPVVDMGAYEFQPCVADFDDGSGLGTPDGGVTIDDLLYYLALFDAGSTRADVDNGTGTGTPDGGVTVEDLLYFLARYGAGC